MVLLMVLLTVLLTVLLMVLLTVLLIGLDNDAKAPGPNDTLLSLPASYFV